MNHAGFIGGFFFILFALIFPAYFLYTNNQLHLAVTVLKYIVFFLILVFIVNLILFDDFSFTKALLTLWPGAFIIFGVTELFKIPYDRRCISSAGFFITFGGIYQYINYQIYVLENPSGQVLGILGVISLSFWPIFAIGALMMVIKIWSNRD